MNKFILRRIYPNLKPEWELIVDLIFDFLEKFGKYLLPILAIPLALFLVALTGGVFLWDCRFNSWQYALDGFQDNWW